MQYFLLSILSVPFLWINYKIVKTDIKEKKIPNKLLGYLLLILPFFFFYNFHYYNINYIFFIFSIFLTFIISFILYYFGIWSAGDAKYLLVLNLFIPQIGIITFIGNISLLTLIYLFLYFLWFYFGKCLFNIKYMKSLYQNIYGDIKDKWLYYKSNKGGKTLNIISKWILLFLIIFVSIRLFRIYIFSNLLNNGGQVNIFLELLKKYNIYLVLIISGVFIGFIWLIKWTLNKIKKHIIKEFKNKIFEKYNISSDIIDYIFITILFLILINFIIYEYFINPAEIKSYLIKIFTLYIGLWAIFKILIYSYKITFSITETQYIDIKDLKEGDIVDKEYLIKMFGVQDSLGYKNEYGILYPDPKDYFNKIKNPIDNETKEKLINIYEIVNTFHKENSLIKENNSIKILKTFAFGLYIFIGFILSYTIGNKIFELIISELINIFKFHF